MIYTNIRTNGKLSIETSLEELGRRVLETDDFKYRQNTTGSCTFRHFRRVRKIPLLVQKSKNFNS